MNGVLILVTRPVGSIPPAFRDSAFSVADKIVFLQSGVHNSPESMKNSGVTLPQKTRLYALDDDVVALKATSGFERIDYPALVDAIEQSEKTITL